MAIAAALRSPGPRTGLLLWLLLSLLAGCGINTIPTLEEQVNSGAPT